MYGLTATLKSRQDFVLALEIESQLRKENPINQRARALRELCEAVRENSVEYVCNFHLLQVVSIGLHWPIVSNLNFIFQGDMEKVRLLIEDFFHPEVGREYCHQAYAFYRCLIACQYDRLHKMRGHIFGIIKNNDIQEDVACRFVFLHCCCICFFSIPHNPAQEL